MMAPSKIAGKEMVILHKLFQDLTITQNHWHVWNLSFTSWESKTQENKQVDVFIINIEQTQVFLDGPSVAHRPVELQLQSDEHSITDLLSYYAFFPLRF